MNESIGIPSADVLYIFWKKKWQICAISIIGGLVTFSASFLLSDKFTSTVLIAPARDEGKPGFGRAAALLGQLGGLNGLGSLAGAGNSTSEYVATLKSSVLTEKFIIKNNLMPILFSDEWDSFEKKWKPETIENHPTLWDAEELFRKTICAVSEDKKTGLITLSITWSDPVLASQWAAAIIEMTNMHLRAKAIDRSQANLEYLNGQLKQTTVVEIQKSIYSLIEAEIKQVMLANASEEYAFRIIDPPRIAQERSSPKRLAYGLSGFMIMFFVALVMILVPGRNESTKRD